MKSRAGIRRRIGYAPLNCLKAYAGGGVKSGEAVQKKILIDHISFADDCQLQSWRSGSGTAQERSQ